MPVFYVETSALIKRYRTEKGTDVVNAVFRERGPADLLVTSYLATVEVEATAARGLKGRVLNRMAYGVMLRSFADDLEEMVVFPVNSSLVTEAAQAARQYALRALDAIHYGTAARAHQMTPTPLVFLASDGDLIQAAQATGFVALNPEEDGAMERLRSLR